MFNKDIISKITLGFGNSNQLGTNARATQRLDATSDEYAIAFRVQKAMTVDQLAITVDAVTGSPTYQVSIQGVNAANGDPDGTIKGGGSPASTQWAPTATGLQWITLDNSHTVSSGDSICIVIEDGTSGTNPDGSNYIDMGAMSVQIARATIPYEMTSTDTGATWTPVVQTLPAIAFRNSGTTNDVQGYPVELFNVLAPTLYATASGEISAAKFKLPASFGKRVKVGGVYLKQAYFTGDHEVGIWDASGTLVGSSSFDKDIASGSSGDITSNFASVWIDTNTTYYAGIKLTSAGAASIYTHDCVTADNTSAVQGYPDGGVVSSQFKASTWSDNTGEVPTEVALLVTEWDRTTDGLQSIDKGFVR
jgi:hypothetical protein